MLEGPGTTQAPQAWQCPGGGDGCGHPSREEFCEIFRAKEKTTGKLYTCKKFLKRDGRKVRKAAKNEIIILKM